MKKMKKWVLVVGLVGQTLLPISCSGTFTREIQSSFVGGFGAFVETATLTFLNQLLSLP